MTDATLIVYVRGAAEPDEVVAECIRVGVGAVRGPSAAGVPSLAGPRDVTLGADPVGELAAVLRTDEADELAVGGSVRALLAGLAAGTHLRVGPGSSTRDAVQQVARAAALARLAGRPPMLPQDVPVHWRTGAAAPD